MEEPAKNNSRGPNRAKPQLDYPLILLCVLLTTVGVLIYIGYDYLKDDTPNAPALIADASESETASDEGREADPEAVAANRESKKMPPKEAKKPDNAPRKETKEPVKKPAETKEASKAAIPAGGKTITHSVKAGETFSSIARRYNLSRQALKALNPQIKDEEKDIKSGVTQLKVKVKAVHTVGPGDILTKVATKYGVTKLAIMAANGKTKDFAQRGEELIIPFP